MKEWAAIINAADRGHTRLHMIFLRVSSYQTSDALIDLLDYDADFLAAV